MLHFFTPPWRTLIVGTGYAARQRAITLAGDPRVKLMGFIGHSPAASEKFAAQFGIEAGDEALLAGAHLVFVCTVNRDHGLWVRRALERGAHVVVEYPLALDAAEGAALVALARECRLLLHVEHIELMSGIHQALAAQMAAVGSVHLARYSSVVARLPEPGRWTFSVDLFGFPLVGALARLSRLVDLVGPVASVFCQNRYFDLTPDGYYRGCSCVAQLQFECGAVGQITYAKGAGCYQSETRLELAGSRGALVHDGEKLTVLDGQDTRILEPGSRKGLFERDTHLVLDVLQGRGELYTTPERSLHILATAAACERSAALGRSEAVEVPALP
ncbi:Gfo/Idh/MocA family protein [Gloeobacter morelensis]|uniref:Gfo/Idh/MocA family oxidoreductase n=1 Tax=Gloeobacter morelensis MG652769 TaxID=2781736 RepID=A0ABY3PSZ8_9CYAN|nr:Gfo/Idh/MocA family oxidoreductase [Gloeobacter morelensis]UFP96622.1 Gfo/Idh/MocA family oxidoreductase [Gloeobacter morelensis MG652769]